MKIKLYRPVKLFHVNQPFGGDPTTYGQFGLKGHNGLDLRAYHGQPVYAAHDGWAFYEVDDHQGHGVIVISDKTYDYDDTNSLQVYFKTIYWHFCDPKKEPQFKSPIISMGLSMDINLGQGQYVKAGDLLGYADNTGFSAGDHLHFGLKRIVKDNSVGGWKNIDQTNGFLGASDPTPFMSDVYAEDVAKLGLLQKIVSLYQQLLSLMKLKG